MSPLATGEFWAGAAERAVKTAAQTLLALWGTEHVVDAFSINVRTALGVALAASVISLLTSVASAPASPLGSPSLVDDRPDVGVHREQHDE
jgi:hypothetical protein